MEESLRREVERLFGDGLPHAGSTARISLVFLTQPTESPDQSSPSEAQDRSPEESPPPPRLPQPLRGRRRRPQPEGPATSMPTAKSTPTSVSPRGFFEDAWNSFWHVVFGILSMKMTSITPIFLLYQLLDRQEINVLVDIGEFIVGQIVGWIFTLL